MNKSILILDTPKSCAECDIRFTDDYTHWCPWKNAQTYVYEYVENKTKPEWCPLSPLPPKKELSHYIQRGDAKGMIHQLLYMQDKGWNDCIDIILGGINYE